NMNRLVEQLLFLARGDSGRTQLQLQTVSLTDLMRELYSECEMIDKQHTYTLHADGEVSVQADRALLKQAARVLCDNAAKYTPEGGEIMLRAGVDSEGAPCLSVEDRGIGISKKDAPSLFNRFFRADKGRQQNAKGSGLGLSIAKWIVQQHGGKLDVTSVENVGTRIRITLPKQETE
ncbi:MAG: sensor histidine kinase, partial [Oscillospiraceae bacterium]|nr:sensor histidine kinase [Oscillospiraceae bacterium]